MPVLCQIPNKVNVPVGCDFPNPEIFEEASSQESLVSPLPTGVTPEIADVRNPDTALTNAAGFAVSSASGEVP
jgi:hypothetical protein